MFGREAKCQGVQQADLLGFCMRQKSFGSSCIWHLSYSVCVRACVRARFGSLNDVKCARACVHACESRANVSNQSTNQPHCNWGTSYVMSSCAVMFYPLLVKIATTSAECFENVAFEINDSMKRFTSSDTTDTMRAKTARSCWKA